MKDLLRAFIERRVLLNTKIWADDIKRNLAM